MSTMNSVRAIIREERLPGLIRRLQEVNALRFYVTRVQALGAGLDPEDFHVSVEEGEAYTGKAVVEVLCASDEVGELTEVIRSSANTGHRGDGVIIVSEVQDVMNVRTGDHGRIALL